MRQNTSPHGCALYAESGYPNRTWPASSRAKALSLLIRVKTYRDAAAIVVPLQSVKNDSRTGTHGNAKGFEA